MIPLPPLAIAILSTAALLLTLAHRKANLGGRATWIFLVSAATYGWVRSLAIRTLSEAHLAAVPYRISQPLASFAGVPVQEIVGWVAAVGLSGYFAERLARRLAGTANACQTALLAGLGMAAVCLAVETAAVSGGWWSWSLGHSTTGLLRFPAIALVDWGFVAIDFLLPFELWRRRAPRSQQVAGWLLFPVHLAGHALTAPLSERIPLSGFDLVHVGLLAGVAAAALLGRDDSPWPATVDERLRLAPAIAVALILSTTTAQLLLVSEPALLWTGLPLALIALLGFVTRVQKGAAARGPGSFRSALGLFVGVLACGLLLRVPAAIRARDFETLLRRGVAALAAGDLGSASELLGKALVRRPSHPEAAWLLGWTELQTGRRAEAREHLENAVAHRPGSVEAVRYLALLDLQEGRRSDAAALLARAKTAGSATRDLAYLAWAAVSASFRLEPAPPELLDVASAAELREVFALARALGDAPTMAAARQRDRERSALPGAVPARR